VSDARFVDELTMAFVIEAGDEPQSLWVRVGAVYGPDGERDEPGVWVEYQEKHMASRMQGPVLLTPAVWRQLAEHVEAWLQQWEKKDA